LEAFTPQVNTLFVCGGALQFHHIYRYKKGYVSPKIDLNPLLFACRGARGHELHTAHRVHVLFFCFRKHGCEFA